MPAASSRHYDNEETSRSFRHLALLSAAYLRKNSTPPIRPKDGKSEILIFHKRLKNNFLKAKTEHFSIIECAQKETYLSTVPPIYAAPLYHQKARRASSATSPFGREDTFHEIRDKP